MPPVRMIWYDGGLKPPTPPEMGDRPLPSENVLYIGEEGKMLGSRVLPGARTKNADSVPRTLLRRGGTWVEWMEACKTGERAGCDFEWSGPLNDAVLLGNIALRTGKRLEWDAAKRRFTDSEEANRLIEAAYHNGWSLDKV
jgi:hypothetical protein